jgi:hypothetical protein
VTPTRLSWELRRGRGRRLRRRRQVVALQLLGVAAMSPIVLYQMGLIRHLPEPPLSWLDADRVDAADEAYAILETPDAVLGIVNYGVTMALAAASGADRAARRPWLPLALAAKVVVDAGNAGRLTAAQWRGHRVFCFWCLLGAAASVASVPLVVAEARAALGALDGAVDARSTT